MVESTIRSVNSNVPIKMVVARRGKQLRAEPIAALYEQHRVHHVGEFSTRGSDVRLGPGRVRAVARSCRCTRMGIHRADERSRADEDQPTRVGAIAPTQPPPCLLTPWRLYLSTPTADPPLLTLREQRGATPSTGEFQ